MFGLFFSIASFKQLSKNFLLFKNSKWFGTADPVFNQDIGYYIFKRPFLQNIYNSIFWFFFVTLVITTIIYLIYFIRSSRVKEFLKRHNVFFHLLVIISMLFLIKAITFKFVAENLLYLKNSNFVGLGFIEEKIWIPYYKIAPYLLIIVFISIILLGYYKKQKLAITFILLYPICFIAFSLSSIIGKGLYVTPNEANVQSSYIKTSIDWTRKAYNIDNKLTFQDYPLEYSLSPSSIQANQDIINNARTTDYNQTLIELNQTQSLKNFYTFQNADISLYNIDGKEKAVYVAAREIDQNSLPSKNYINTKMKYTHGSGVVMAPINEVTTEGEPLTIIKDLGARSINGAPDVREPRIYYGENFSGYAVVATKDGEYDEITNNYKYQGAGGIELTPLNRLLLGLRYFDGNLIFSKQITSTSRLMINRNVVDRAHSCFPFLEIDDDAHIIIDGDGKLKWIIDGYTTSDAFPLAASVNGKNYYRSSVKIVIDAYNGNVSAYIIDESDPIIMAYRSIYPEIFAKDKLPDDIAKHIRYPEKLFDIQAEILKKYNTNDPIVFYQQNTLWESAKEKSKDDKPEEMPSYYTYYNNDLVITKAFTPSGKENLVAYLTATGSIKNYGKLTCYKFPNAESVIGPYQVENRIDTDENISAKLTLWGQGGSSIIRGNLIILPISNTLLYIEPIYLTSGDEKKVSTVLRGIILAYGDKVIMEDTLQKALQVMFEYKPNTPSTPTTEQNIKKIIDSVSVYFEEYKNNLAKGKWKEAAESLQNLEQSLKDLSDYKKEIR
ncbi:UPF0182 family protein [Treponema sp. R6D11]